MLFRFSPLVLIFLFITLSFPLPNVQAQGCAAEAWDSEFVRPGSIVPHVVLAHNGKLYVAGQAWLPITLSGGTRNRQEVRGVFTWDGQKWNYPSYDNGLTSGGGSWRFRDIVPYGNSVVVAGGFTKTNAGDTTLKYIAAWNGTNWSPLGTGLNAKANALATTGNLDIYAGGSFTQAGGAPASRIARWTMQGGWQALPDVGQGGEGCNAEVVDIVINGGKVVCCGGFTTAGGSFANHLAGWNWTTSEWTQIGNGVDISPTNIASWVNDLYVNGVNQADTTTITGIAHWDGSSWEDLPLPLVAGVQHLVTRNTGDIVIAGSFGSEFDLARRNVAQWNPFTFQWEAVTTNCHLTNNAPTYLAADGTDLFVVPGGGTGSCGQEIGRVAKLHNGQWRGMGEGMNTNAAWGLSVNVAGDDVYVGGLYGHLGGIDRSNGIARWNVIDNLWSPLGMNDTNGVRDGSFNGTVRDTELHNDTLYLAGTFSHAGTVQASRVAGWDGTGFFALGKGGDAATNLYTVESFQNELYLGGLFFTMTNSDNTTVGTGGLVKWDGSKYSFPTNSPLTGFQYVYDLEATDAELYVGGQFNSGLNKPSANVIKFDGTNWLGVGKGVVGRVYDVDISGADVYVAGGFIKGVNPDDSQVDLFRLGRWDGSQWHTLGTFNDTVRTIYVRGSEIYAGGDFTDIGGLAVRHIAYYDGSQWNQMGAGTEGLEFTNNGQVYDLEAQANDLWVVGRFTHAGEKPASNVTRWAFCTAAPPTFAGGSTGAIVNGNSVMISWDIGGGGSQSPSAITYELQLGEGSGFTVIAREITGITGNSQQVYGLAENSDFSWRVRQNVDGQPGAWSARETLVTTDAIVCCGIYTSGQTGNTNCDIDGKKNLADITKLIDRVFLSKTILCCEKNGNVDGDVDSKMNLSDITSLIDHIFLTKAETAACN